MHTSRGLAGLVICRSSAERSGKFDLPPWVSDEVQRAAKVSSKDQYAQSALGYARCRCISNRAKSSSTRRPLLFRIRSDLLRTRRSCSPVSTTLFKAWLYKLASLLLGLPPKSTKVCQCKHGTQRAHASHCTLHAVIMPAPLHTPLTLAASFGAGLVASVPHSITPC